MCVYVCVFVYERIFDTCAYTRVLECVCADTCASTRCAFETRVVMHSILYLYIIRSIYILICYIVYYGSMYTIDII